MLNNCEIKDVIAKDQWFYSTGNEHSNHQQAAEKGYEQIVKSDKDLSVSRTKTSGWRVLQIGFHGIKQVTKYGSELIEIIDLFQTKTDLFSTRALI